MKGLFQLNKYGEPTAINFDVALALYTQAEKRVAQNGANIASADNISDELSKRLHGVLAAYSLNDETMESKFHSLVDAWMPISEYQDEAKRYNNKNSTEIKEKDLSCIEKCQRLLKIEMENNSYSKFQEMRVAYKEIRNRKKSLDECRGVLLQPLVDNKPYIENFDKYKNAIGVYMDLCCANQLTTKVSMPESALLTESEIQYKIGLVQQNLLVAISSQASLQRCIKANDVYISHLDKADSTSTAHSTTGNISLVQQKLRIVKSAHSILENKKVPVHERLNKFKAALEENRTILMRHRDSAFVRWAKKLGVFVATVFTLGIATNAVKARFFSVKGRVLVDGACGPAPVGGTNPPYHNQSDGFPMSQL